MRRYGSLININPSGHAVVGSRPEKARTMNNLVTQKTMKPAPAELIHLARHTVPPVAIIILARTLFCFPRF